MTPSSTLASLRQFFHGENILICFNGPISRTLIGEIGVALKDHIEASLTAKSLTAQSLVSEPRSADMDVFSVYIEMSQNIRNYALAQSYDDLTASATVVIAATSAGHYAVSAGNIVESSDGEALLQRIHGLSVLSKPELKALYKTQLRQPRSTGQGAGLGLIEIARRASQPLEPRLDPQPGGRSFFSLRVVI